jgi:hypothetical protein
MILIDLPFPYKKCGCNHLDVIPQGQQAAAKATLAH